jgi:hypothetical protein
MTRLQRRAMALQAMEATLLFAPRLTHRKSAATPRAAPNRAPSTEGTPQAIVGQWKSKNLCVPQCFLATSTTTPDFFAAQSGLRLRPIRKILRRPTGGKTMKLRPLASGAVLLAAAVASLSSPASAAGHRHGLGWHTHFLNLYYPPDAYYYSAPHDQFGPVGPFVGYDAGFVDGHWHPAYWQIGHHGYRYIAF